MTLQKRFLLFTTLMLTLLSLVGVATIAIIFQPNFPELLGLTKVEEVNAEEVVKELEEFGVLSESIDCIQPRIEVDRNSVEGAEVEITEVDEDEVNLKDIYVEFEYPDIVDLEKYNPENDLDLCDMQFSYKGSTLTVAYQKEETKDINFAEDFAKVSEDGRIIRPNITELSDELIVDTFYEVRYGDLVKKVADCDEIEGEDIRWPCGKNTIFSDVGGFSIFVKIPESKRNWEKDQTLEIFDSIVKSLSSKEYDVQEISIDLMRPIGDIILTGDDCSDMGNSQDVKCNIKDIDSEKVVYVFTYKQGGDDKIYAGKKIGNSRYILREISKDGETLVKIYEFDFISEIPTKVDELSLDENFIEDTCGTSYNEIECLNKLKDYLSSENFDKYKDAIEFFETKLRYIS